MNYCMVTVGYSDTGNRWRSYSAVLVVSFAVFMMTCGVYAENPLQVPFPEEELNALADPFQGRIGFYAKIIGEQQEYSWNAQQRFPPASVIKLPVMVELYRRMESGQLDPEQTILLPDDISTHGSGILKRQDPPVVHSLREYCRLMMVHSDNMATDIVMRTVGQDAANRFLDQQGFHRTRVSLEMGRWHYLILGMENVPISREQDERLLKRIKAGKFDNDGLGYSDSLSNNVCGPRDVGLLLQRLYVGELAGKKSTRTMLDLLRASTHKQTVAKYVTKGIQVANKYGGSQRIAADAAIVELKNRPLVIAAFAISDQASDRSGREILARMARLAIAACDPQAVVPLEASSR